MYLAVSVKHLNIVTRIRWNLMKNLIKGKVAKKVELFPGKK